MTRAQTKIKSPNQLSKILKRKSKVVFTNGCFDLLHKGHVSYLEEAKRLGKILVVALNTDESVSKIKGPSRPIQTLDSRAHVMAALECVDFVTWFEESTPVDLLRKLKPGIYVKGADWKGKNIPEEAVVKQWKGKIKYLKFVDGHSSSLLIAKARG